MTTTDGRDPRDVCAVCGGEPGSYAHRGRVSRRDGVHKFRPTVSTCDAHSWVYTYDEGPAMHCDDCRAVKPGSLSTVEG